MARRKPSLPENYRRVMERIGEAADRAGRPTDEIVCIAVTKYAGPDQIRGLIELGHRDLGENRVQQLQQRVAMADEFLSRRKMISEGDDDAPDLPESVRWHMIGHLQRNKVKTVIPLVTLIHSVDSLRVVEELENQATRMDREVELLLQINASGEESKYGLAPPSVPHLADQMDTMPHLKLRGLMTMAPYSENPEDSRRTFERTAELFHDMNATGRFGRRFNLLSMGMSNDYEIAIECGANLLRIGRGFFGEAENTDE